MKSLVLAALLAGVLSACASTPRGSTYDCPLDTAEGAKCASMEDAYRASKTMVKGGNSRVQSVFDRRVQASPSETDATPVVGQLSNYGEPGQVGMPVFKQPKVMRAWVAPYVDADGNLRSGEYTYFSTPGQWNYGTLNKAGDASGMFQPSKTGNLGYNASIQVKPDNRAPASAARPAAPPEAQAAAQSAQSSQQPARPQSDSSGTITQPYQRIAN